MHKRLLISQLIKLSHHIKGLIGGPILTYIIYIHTGSKKKKKTYIEAAKIDPWRSS